VAVSGQQSLHGHGQQAMLFASAGSIMTIRFSRCFAMPNAETFSVKPIGEFVQRFLADAKVSVDPFARNRDWATYTNDINPAYVRAVSSGTPRSFLASLRAKGVVVDLALFDPPYSARQIAEHYKAAGLPVTSEDTQNGRLFRRVRDALDAIVRPGGIVLSFGWQSVGMGMTRGYELFETMLVAHGGGHNDTICIAERKPILHEDGATGSR
jgi:hypothetical protein